MKKTLIAFALVAMYGTSFAQTTTANTVTVGDNRNGQVATGGSIANGANVQAFGGQAGAGGAGGAGGTSNVAAGAATSTSGPATSTSGAATTTGGTANTTGGSIGAVTQGSNGALTQGSIGSLTGGNITSTAGAVTGGTSTVNGGTNTSTNSNAGVNGSSTVTVTTTSANDLAIAKEQAAAQVEAARILSDIKIRNTPNVSATPLTASNDTCMGSTGVGGSGPGFGISIGSTWTDGNCKMLKNSRELWNMGMREASMALMCTDAANKEALELTGYVCPQTKRDQAKMVSASSVPANEPTDPLVRSRMGLPPLK